MTGELTVMPDAVARAMRAELPSVAEQTVAEIIVEVPSYADAFSGRMGQKIRNAVELTLAGFLELATAGTGVDPSTPIGPALAAAYELGRGEARDGRSMDALQAAYRVGARVSWREMSATAVRAGLSVEHMARFAELVFAFIDQLSAASVAGHSDELATTGRVRQRYLERLATLLLAGAPADELLAAAERAGWTPPRTLTAVLLPEERVRGAMVSLDPRTLRATVELPELPERVGEGELVVLLVPDAEGRSRPALLRSLDGRGAVVGPARPWPGAADSHARVVRAVQLGLTAGGTEPLDTDCRLTELVLRADETALADLRERALAPLADLGESAREKLTETLRSWLLHQGRRDAVAAELFVHPQTVRYRMGQLRELYGDRLEDPRAVLELVLALGVHDGTTTT
ncbi:helix-turn-helix domain-containing protein [Blastococcus sp. TML/M2B]|uniref:PucR family transcriptional regulator n=1 Tax=unclassified Blastococcus TaxID=2619396 RepID=UPI00190BD3D3|nr:MULTISPECIES: PucR family transcriptional regulator [unclassified Blastococcus]MBN1094506.1 helix-turn-helix domain-containing protein [Blastococcus sp. TML/M2B]MBN1095464.1 helix-turn-helix domain-containing protein [Blastococcus sp. TML/C7B]